MSAGAELEAARYYVACVDGYLTPRRGAPGLPHRTAHVIDRLNCRRVVAQYRSEDLRGYGRSVEGRRAQVARLAELEAARLNRLHSHSERDPARRQ